MPPFRFAAKNVFLTYAQADGLVDKDNVFDSLKARFNPMKIIVGQEQHQDGGLHFHVVMSFAAMVETRNERMFDLGTCHPNIQTVRSIKNAVAYCAKDGNYKVDGFVVNDMESLVENAIREADAGGSTGEIIVRVVRSAGDRGLKVINQLETFVNYLRKPGVVHEPQREYPGNFVLPAIEGWKIEQFVRDIALPIGDRGTRKSIWLTGPSRLGKTVLARSLGTHWYMNGAWNVDCYSDEAEYGVLDDIEWERLKPYYKGILGCQLDVTVTDKYRRKSVIRGGKCVIVITNEQPEFSNEERYWLNANVHFVDVFMPLYNQIEFVLEEDEDNNQFVIPSSD